MAKKGPRHITPMNIMHMRIATDLAKADAARIVGTHPNTWHAWERGESAMPSKKFALFIHSIENATLIEQDTRDERVIKAVKKAKPTVTVHNRHGRPIGLLSRSTVREMTLRGNDRIRVTSVFYEPEVINTLDGCKVRKQRRQWQVTIDEAFSPKAYRFAHELCAAAGG